MRLVLNREACTEGDLHWVRIGQVGENIASAIVSN